MLGVGDTAPELKLTDLHGVERPLRDRTAAKPVLLAFFKISCPTCQYTLPFIERFAQNDNLDVIAISQDDAEATQEFHEAFGVTVPTLLDEQAKGYPASNAFGITHVPSIFLLEPDGTIGMAVAGYSNRDLEAVGNMAGLATFREGERVLEWKAG